MAAGQGPNRIETPKDSPTGTLGCQHLLSPCRGDGGLKDVDEEPLEIEMQFQSFDDYWAPFPTGLAPSGAYCASLGPAEQEALREACFYRLGSPDGPFTLTARAWYAVGVV